MDQQLTSAPSSCELLQSFVCLCYPDLRLTSVSRYYLPLLQFQGDLVLTTSKSSGMASRQRGYHQCCRNVPCRLMRLSLSKSHKIVSVQRDSRPLWLVQRHVFLAPSPLLLSPPARPFLSPFQMFHFRPFPRGRKPHFILVTYPLFTPALQLK